MLLIVFDEKHVVTFYDISGPQTLEFDKTWVQRLMEFDWLLDYVIDSSIIRPCGFSICNFVFSSSELRHTGYAHRIRKTLFNSALNLYFKHWLFNRSKLIIPVAQKLTKCFKFIDLMFLMNRITIVELGPPHFCHDYLINKTYLIYIHNYHFALCQNKNYVHYVTYISRSLYNMFGIL